MGLLLMCKPANGDGMRTRRITYLALAVIICRVHDFGPDRPASAAVIHIGTDEGTPRLPRDGDGFPLPESAFCRLGSKRFWQKGPVYSLLFLPSGKQMVSAEDDHIIMWEASTGNRIGTLHGHRGSVDTVAVSGDGKMLASSGEDRTVRVWDTHRGVELRRILKREDSRAPLLHG